MIRAGAIIAGGLLIGACSNEPAGPPLEITALAIYAPLPGSTAAVAYMDIENLRDAPLMISEVTSPEFDRVEIHESLLEDGISRMRRLESLTVPARGYASLTERGKHLMLLEPRAAADVDAPVSLHIRFSVAGDGDAEIILRSTLKSRIRLEDKRTETVQ